MLTLGQARYLLVLNQLRGRDRAVTKIAGTLGVSKPSVTSMIDSFEEKGLLQKGPGLNLTAQGKALAEEITGKQAIIASYFARELEITKEEAGRDALVLMFELSEKFLERLIKKIEIENARSILREFYSNAYLTSFQGILPDGVYQIPFRVLKKNDSGLSMGDKGLAHPAKLVVADGYGVLSLRAVLVTHRALRGYTLKGRVARFFFWNGESYAEVREQDEGYAFPVMHMYWSHDPVKGVEFGVLQIKVQASVGAVNMPESSADMAVYLDPEKFF